MFEALQTIGSWGVTVFVITFGYLPSMPDLELWKAIAVGMAVLLLALFLGYMMGDGHDHLQDVGSLGTAQRGTSSALIVAQANFDDPRVLVVNTLGIVLLIAAAKVMSLDNGYSVLIPAAADPPHRRREEQHV